MPTIHPIRQLLARLSDRLSGLFTTRPSPDQPTGTGTGPSFSPPVPSSTSEVFLETGLHPEAYLLQLVESKGGRVKQGELCAWTGWPKSTVSILLSEMEATGQLTRIQVGREKVVCLPSALPDGGAAESDGRVAEEGFTEA